MRTLLLIFFFFVFQIENSTAQLRGKELIDSLHNELKKTSDKVSKAKLLNSIAYEYRATAPEKAIEFSQQSLSINKNTMKDEQALSHIIMGTAYIFIGNMDSSLIELEYGFNLLKKYPNKRYEGIALSNLGLYNQNIGEFEKAKDYYAHAVKIFRETNFKKVLSSPLNNLGIIFMNQGEYDSALVYYSASLKIRQEINDKKGVGDSYNNIGLIYDNIGNSPEAIRYYTKSLEIRTELNDANGIAASNNNIGIIYMWQGEYPKALKYFYDALKKAEEIKYNETIIAALTNIGLTYEKQELYHESITINERALKLCKETEDKNNAAKIYNNLGDDYYYLGLLDKSMTYRDTSIKLYEEMGNKSGVAESYSNIGLIKAKQKKFSEAIQYQNKSIEIKIELSDISGLSNSYYNLGMVHFEMKNYPVAKNSLNKGLDFAKQVRFNEGIQNSYKLLSQVDSAQGNYAEAFNHFKLFTIYRDSLFNEENTRKTVQTQMQYDFDKKESLTKAEQEKKDAITQEEMQKQKLVRNGFIGGFAVVVFFAGIFFTQRNRIKKGKQRSDELLLNILPEEVAEELKAKGSADAKHFDDVTVMFTDFKGFTQISEKLSPTELVSEIHTCFKAFDNIIAKHNIEKIKTIGDSYMCAGGLPVANKSHADDVVNAALEIQQFMQQHLLERKNSGKEIFEIRIGIHTGPVVAGIVGVKKFAYDIWGDTVNIASRMESSGEAGKINISGSTHELVKEKFKCIHRGKIQAKNKGEIDMYFIELG